MSSISFFIPVREEGNNIFIRFADSYCNLGNIEADLLRSDHSNEKETRYCLIKDAPQSLFILALKVLSYVALLGIPWVIACAIKMCHRYKVDYVKQQEGPGEPENDTEIESIITTNISSTNSQQTTPVSAESAAAMQAVQQNLINWWIEERGLRRVENLGTQKYVEQLQQIASSEPASSKKEVTLYNPSFSWGSTLYYAMTSENEKYFPIFWDLGLLLSQAKKENVELPWLMIDPQTGQSIIIQVKEITKLTDSSSKKYISQLIGIAKQNKRSKEFRILEALIPYAFRLKNYDLNQAEYNQLRALMPAYPENPVERIIF
jgi:hypothetical protein